MVTYNGVRVWRIMVAVWRGLSFLNGSYLSGGLVIYELVAQSTIPICWSLPGLRRLRLLRLVPTALLSCHQLTKVQVFLTTVYSSGGLVISELAAQSTIPICGSLPGLRRLYFVWDRTASLSLCHQLTKVQVFLTTVYSSGGLAISESAVQSTIPICWSLSGLRLLRLEPNCFALCHQLTKV